MNFKMPETLVGLSVEELNKLHADALAESKEISAIAEDEITDEQIDALETLAEHLATIAGARSELEQAAAKRAERIAAAKASVEAHEVEPEEPAEEAEPIEEPEAAEDPEDVAEGELPATPEGVTIPDDASDLIEEKEKEPVAAHKSVAKVAASNAVDEVLPEVEAVRPKATIIASADVSGFQAGQELDDMGEIVQAFLNRARSFGSGREGQLRDLKGAKVFGLSENAKRAGVAHIQKPEMAFSTGMDDPIEKQMETIFEAAKESRLEGGSLVAAGGWCAPSEIWYDSFLALESNEGMLDMPEVTARRGGIQFTRGPQLSDLLNIVGGFGFDQTEAEAEAGTTKTCHAVECPEFTEVRMDAVGYCLTSGVLTNKAYPELVRRTLELARLAHRRTVNAKKIQAIVTAAGTAIDHGEIGAATSDLLDALAIQATRIRYLHSMSPNATIEVVLPIWAKEVLRADVSRRANADLLSVSDAQINAWFSARNLRVQYVYDWQPFDTTATAAWTRFPQAVNAVLYPAGTFVALTSDVVDFDAIYDSVGLSTNTYTAAFFEEGLAVAHVGGTAVQVSIGLNTYGNLGALDVAAPAAPAAG